MLQYFKNRVNIGAEIFQQLYEKYFFNVTKIFFITEALPNVRTNILAILKKMLQ